jgi:hypothetical protein
MSFKSFLSAAGHDIGVGLKDVFNFLGSAQGQATIAGVETGAATITSVINPAAGAALVGFEGLLNAGLKEVVAVEASAAAAGMQSGTGAQKSAAVIAAISPNVGTFLQSIGVTNATAAQEEALATALSNGIVSILNAIPAPATTA